MWRNRHFFGPSCESNRLMFQKFVVGLQAKINTALFNCKMTGLFWTGENSTRISNTRCQDFVRPSFEKYWQGFLSFLTKEGLSTPSVNQCEITYVNHIKRNEGWASVDEWEQVFNVIRKNQPADFLPAPGMAHFNYSYLMPDKSGRLRVEANPVIRKSDGSQAIAFSLVARGKPRSTETADILNWFDLGREWIVRGFADLTHEKNAQDLGKYTMIDYAAFTPGSSIYKEDKDSTPRYNRAR